MISEISMTFKFVGKDPEAEAVKFLGERIMIAAQVVKPQATVTVNAVSADSVAVTEPVKVEAPKSKGRPAGAKNKPKEAKQVPFGSPDPTVPSALPTETMTVDHTMLAVEPTVVFADLPATQEQAQEALSRVFAKFGMESAMGLLQEHGARRVSDLKPEDRAAFVKAADLKANS